MSLNQAFLTSEEEQAQEADRWSNIFPDLFDEKKLPPIHIGNLVSDDSKPADYIANPEPNASPVLMEDVMLINRTIAAYESALADLSEIRSAVVEMNGMNREFASALESYVPELIAKRPLSSFSTHTSKTNYQISLEEIDKKRMAMWGGLVAALLALCYKLYKWLFGKSGDGDGTSVGGGEDVETRSDVAETSSEAAKVTEAAEEELAKRHSGNRDVTATLKELEATIKEAVDGTTEGKTISFLATNRQIQDLYRALVGSAPDQIRAVASRLVALKSDIDAALTGTEGKTPDAYMRLFTHLRQVGDGTINPRAGTGAMAPAQNTSISGMIPMIDYRNPRVAVPETTPEYIKSSGVMVGGLFYDIGTVKHYLTDPNGLSSQIQEHRSDSSDLNKLLEDVTSLAKSAIVTEYVANSNKLESAMKEANERIKEDADTLSNYLNKLDKSTMERLKKFVPGIYNRDPSVRDDLAGTGADAKQQEPSTAGTGTAGVTADGETIIQATPTDARLLSQVNNPENVFKFLENELGFKAREITNWGSVFGIIARDISIINVRLTARILKSKSQAFSELRRHLTGEGDLSAAKKAAEKIDSDIIGVMKMVLDEVRAGQITLSKKPRSMRELGACLVEGIKKFQNSIAGMSDEKDIYAAYQKELVKMADIFDKEISGQVANRLRSLGNNVAA